MQPTIHVIATTDHGTAAALRAATPLAARRHARVVLLVPQIMASDDEENAPSTNWTVTRYDALARRLHQAVQIRVCVSGSVADAVTRMTPLNATVIVGGRTSIVWSTSEERLAAKLRRSGRNVVFIGVDSRA